MPPASTVGGVTGAAPPATAAATGAGGFGPPRVAAPGGGGNLPPVGLNEPAPPIQPNAAGGARLWEFIHALRVGSLAGGVQTIAHIALNTPLQTAWKLVADVPTVVMTGHPENIPAEFVGLWNGLDPGR